jgi:regulator of sirC expression with transglutaminase-like and TPR domain
MDALERFRRIVDADTEAVPLDEAAFCIAAAARPGLDIGECLHRLDALAAQCRDATFDGVRAFLFEEEQFRGDIDDYGDPRNSFLDAVIERRLGIPITLSVLLIEVARRVGVDVVGVGMPGHFLAREAAVTDRWCDPFHRGAVLDYGECAVLFAAVQGKVRPLEAGDLAPTPPRAILTRILANLEQGRFGTDPAHLATLCELHLAIPGVPVEQQVQLLRALARVDDPARVQRAYDAVVSRTTDDDAAGQLRTDARRVLARWN